MPSPGHGAIGSLDYTSQERKTLANRSQSYKCPECGDVTKKLLPLTSKSNEVKEEMETYAAQLSMQGETKNKQAAPVSIMFSVIKNCRCTGFMDIENELMSFQVKRLICSTAAISYTFCFRVETSLTVLSHRVTSLQNHL